MDNEFQPTKEDYSSSGMFKSARRGFLLFESFHYSVVFLFHLALPGTASYVHLPEDMSPNDSTLHLVRWLGSSLYLFPLLSTLVVLGSSRLTPSHHAIMSAFYAILLIGDLSSFVPSSSGGQWRSCKMMDSSLDLVFLACYLILHSLERSYMKRRGKEL